MEEETHQDIGDAPAEVPDLELPAEADGEQQVIELPEELCKGRCMKCRDMVQIKDPELVDLKNPKKTTRGIRGSCPACESTVFRILPANLSL